MEHKWLRNFDSKGKWTKPERVIRVNGAEHDLDEYAHEHGVELPDSKKHKIAKKAKIEVNSNADMEQQDDSGDIEES